nr:OB-fold-containig protein [uncultured Flavobacterium sp.]
MAELVNLLFHPLSNGIMTVLTGLSLLYWVFTLISGDGIDLDASGEIGDFDTTTEGDVAEPGFFSEVLNFINIGKVPIMVIITLFKFISWIVTIVTSLVIDISAWGTKSVLILIPIFILVYFSMHWFTKPLVKLYANMGYHGDEALDFIGRTGILKSTIENDKIGMAQIVINKDVINLNVKSKDGKQIPYGSEIIVLDETTDQKIYLVSKNLTITNF